MNGNRTSRLAFAVFLSSAALAVAPTGYAEPAHMHDDHEVHAEADIGTVDFNVSCDDTVRSDFDRALGLMHHMMYQQARSAFLAVIEADADCAMAHWGVATTLFQPLWGTRPNADEMALGRRHIRTADGLTSGGGRERLLIDATQAFFRDPDSVVFWTRIERWAGAMRTAHLTEPADKDTAAIYALSLLTLAQRDAERRDALHDEAETVLRAIWEREPRHPGAIHYSIHATDVDGRAQNALDLVEAYGRIAPEVPHALHMPSHIYVRLGDWDRVIAWNRRSADAALHERVNGAVSHHFIHAVDYMLYAYLQQGEDGKARDVFEEAMGKDRHQASFISAYHLAALPARKAVERRDWESAADLEPRSPGYVPWDAARWPEGMSWYARGLGGVHTGQLDIAREAAQRLAALRDKAQAEDDAHFATYLEVDRKILAGWMAHAHGQADEAVRLMRAAAKLERTVEKHPVTPGALLPPNEALGDLLLKLGRPDEAVQAYLASNQLWPGRFNTLLGAARAARAAGDEATALEWYLRLREMASGSDRPELAEAERLLEGRLQP